MGKKKTAKKTKELSVAIAESASIGGASEAQQQQTPRKRGRPRKIVEKTENEEIIIKEELGQEAEVEVAESESKKAKMGEEEEEQEKMKEVATSSSTVVAVGDTKKVEDAEQPKGPPPRRSRARRKSKPRKSS